MVRSFFCALIASVTVQLIDPYRGKRVLYQVFYTKNWLVFEILFFVVIGALGGILGSFFLRAYKYSLDFRYSNPLKHIAFIAGITSFIAYFNIFTRIDGTELLESLFRECNPNEHLGLCETSVKWKLVLSLLEAFVVKTIFPVVTYGAMIPGGLFGPVMVSGALAGRVIGELVQMMHVTHSDWLIFSVCPKDELCITPGMYSLLGAMAAFSGLTKLSVSLTVIMFELTGTLNYIVPSMITLIVSKYTGDLFERVGFLEMIIQMKGYPFLDPRQDYSLSMPVGDKMTALKDLVCIPARGITLENLETTLASNIYQGYPVVTSQSDSNLVGYVDREEVLREIGNAKSFVRGFGKKSVITFEEEFEDNVGLNMSMLVDQVLTRF
jgi:chloride channel 3/4/5